MGQKTEQITDTRTLRAIAHPIRLRLYEMLMTGGPSTVTRLAKSVAGAPGSLSYHLRQLAEYGFVEEAPELRKDERERWWRAIPGGIRWSQETFPDTPGAREVLSAAEHLLVSRRVERLRSWLEQGERRWGQEWVAAARGTDTVLHLSPGELRAMGTEIDAVLNRWAASSRTSGSTDRKAPVFAFFHAFPLDDSPTPRSDDLPAKGEEGAPGTADAHA